jgi:hypothetical protein
MIRHARLSFTLAFSWAAIAACSSSGASGGGPGPSPSGTAPPAPTDAPPAHVGACPEGEPFRLVSGKIVVDARLDDGGRQSWVLDTGAFTSVADTSLAPRVQGRDVKVSVGGIEKTIQLDTMDVKASMRMDVAGILGQDVFGEVLTLDYPRKRFFIDPALDDAREADLRACGHVKGAPATVDAIHDLFLHVKGTAEGKPGWFLVDSGASFGAMRKGFFASIDKAHPRPSIGGFYTPAAIGTFWARLATVGSLEVGGHEVRHIVTRTMDDKLLSPPKGVTSEEFIGVLPSLFLRHFMVTADFKKKKLRLDPAKDDPMSEPTTFYSVGLGIAESTQPPILVADVLPGSAAEKAGIAVGDEITAIGGTPIAGMDPYARAWRLVSDRDGDKITITIKHAGDESVKELVTSDLLTSPKM